MRPRWRRLVALVALLATASIHLPEARAAEPSDKAAQDAARERFMRGVQLHEEGDYKLALIEFERAYAIAPSYKMLFNIGQEQQQLGHYAKAIVALERYLADGGTRIPAERRRKVEEDIATLRGRTAKLSVVVSPEGAEVTFDGEPLAPEAFQEQLVDAGEHRLRATAVGHEAAERTVTLAGGDDVNVELTLRPQPLIVRTEAPARRIEVKPPSTSGIWIGWAGTAALAAGAGVCGALALSSSSSLREAKDTPGTTYADRQQTASRAQTFGIVTDVLAGAAVVAAGITLYVMLSRPSSSVAPSRAAARRASPMAHDALQGAPPAGAGGLGTFAF